MQLKTMQRATTAVRSLMSAARQLPTRASASRSVRAATEGATQGPNGLLFGEKPPALGESRVKESWENVYVWTMVVTFAAGAYIHNNRKESAFKKQAEESLDA
eukprot:m.356127 g.356127  ORF g.356127 m.356127 type:complete len:103 (+) comp17446_c0_seq1:94-402(+)